MNERSIHNLSNHDLVQSLGALFDHERRTTHFILLHLKEIQTRKLYADMGFPDLFTMLVRFFKQSESAANQRLQALRLMNDVPEIKERLVAGELNLSTLAMAQRQIRREEKVTGVKVAAAKKAEIVKRISSKTMAEAEKELLSLLPESSKTLATHERRISTSETRLSLTIPDRVKEKMEELKNRWAAVNPEMDHLELIERALDIALAKTDKKKHSATASVAQDSKVISKKSGAKLPSVSSNAGLEVKWPEPPAETRKDLPEKTPTSNRKTYYSRATDQILWSRADSRCEYIDTASERRCLSKFGLERDHIIPLAKGGTNDIQNLRLLCRTHNQLMARRHFGADKIRQNFL